MGFLYQESKLRFWGRCLGFWVFFLGFRAQELFGLRGAPEVGAPAVHPSFKAGFVFLVGGPSTKRVAIWQVRGNLMGLGIL